MIKILFNTHIIMTNGTVLCCGVLRSGNFITWISWFIKAICNVMYPMRSDTRPVVFHSLSKIDKRPNTAYVCVCVCACVCFHSKILTNIQSSPDFMSFNQMATPSDHFEYVSRASIFAHFDWSIYGKRAKLWLHEHINKKKANNVENAVCNINSNDCICFTGLNIHSYAHQIKTVTIYQSNWCKWKWNAYAQ